jgi:DNA-binding response OmpR family regulator
VPKALCIDDDAPIREMLNDALTEAGYEVTTVADGAEGLKAFKRSHYDLVVTDLLVPKLDGIRLAEEIRAIDPAAKILVITAITHSLAKELGSAPIDGYFAKPLPMKAFLARVKALVPP